MTPVGCVRRLVVAVACAGAIVLGGCKAEEGAGRVVRIDVTAEGFEPREVHVPHGEAVTLVITRRTAQTCATEAVFKSTGKTYPLPLNQPVKIELPAAPAGRIGFACAMDMYRGEIVVE